VLERDLGGSAREPQPEKRLGAGAVVDLDPAECVRGREVDDFDDRFVLVGVTLEGQLVAGTFSGGLVARRGFHRDTVRQPLGHSERLGNEREDFVDWRWYAGGIRERDRSHGPSVGIRYIYFEAVLRDNNIGKDFLRLFDQLIRADRVPSRYVGQHEPLGLRGESDLRGFFGGRMPGVARAIALFLAEGCFVNQQIGTLPGIHRRCGWPGVARECDEPAWPGNADEAIGQDLQDLFSQPFELLLGRRTYEIFAAYWPRVPVDSDSRAIADLFNSVPKHVATHRSDTLDWQNSHALEGDLADAIRALKQQDGANLLTHGSGDMVRQLLAAGLVDELRLMIYPVVLGRGKHLFGNNAQPSAFTLAHSTSTPSGVLLTRYARSGEVRTGAFGDVE